MTHAYHPVIGDIPVIRYDLAPVQPSDEEVEWAQSELDLSFGSVQNTTPKKSQKCWLSIIYKPHTQEDIIEQRRIGLYIHTNPKFNYSIIRKEGYVCPDYNHYYILKQYECAYYGDIDTLMENIKVLYRRLLLSIEHAGTWKIHSTPHIGKCRNNTWDIVGGCIYNLSYTFKDVLVSNLNEMLQSILPNPELFHNVPNNIPDSMLIQPKKRLVVDGRLGIVKIKPKENCDGSDLVIQVDRPVGFAFNTQCPISIG